MISVEKYFDLFQQNDVEFFTGVPDSLLKNFVSFVDDKLDSKNHVITANEGSAISLSAGYHLATNKVPVVYFQNSGLGNAINPLVSLVDEAVYKIPMILLIGWRGEPTVKDEPQHIKQGEVTLEMLRVLGIPFVILDEDENESISKTQQLIADVKQRGIVHAIVVKKGVFQKYKVENQKKSHFEMSRELAMKTVLETFTHKEFIVSTTGKLSRELFEYRATKKQPHNSDFLTVGSMGHASMIALGIAKQKPSQRVVCFDGDGALLMHSGNMSSIGFSGVQNYTHIVFNNGAHESVGGQDTLALKVDLPLMATSNGYSLVQSVSTKNDLKESMIKVNQHKGVSFLEIKVKMESRSNLGRPTLSPIENKLGFMNKISLDE